MRRRLGRLVVVGGHTRGVGKTALAEQLLLGWDGGPIAAVKISAHRHAPEGCPAPLIEEAFTPSPTTQTGRYLAAGADRAWLCRCPAERMADAARFVRDLQDDGWAVVVESNRIVQHLRPDLTFFVVSDRTDDWKPSSGPCLQRADALVLSAGTVSAPAWPPALVRPANARLPVVRFTPNWTVPGIERWTIERPARPSDVRSSIGTSSRPTSSSPSAGASPM